MPSRPGRGRPVVVVLAGGEGRRLGGAKAEALLGGTRLVDRAVARARAWSDIVLLAVRRVGQVADAGLPQLLDDPRLDGPLAALAPALALARARRRPAVLLLAVDLPFLPHDLAARLAAGMGPAPAAVATAEAVPQPIVSLWRAGVEPGDAPSLRALAHRLGARGVELGAAAMADIDTPDDLARAKSRLAQAG